MKTIRNYNPNLGLTLNDLKMLMMLEDEICLRAVIDAVIKSVDCNTSFTLAYEPNQIAYDLIMGKVLEGVEEYNNQLIEKGYTQEDIEEYYDYKNNSDEAEEECQNK